MQVLSLGWDNLLEEGLATCSSILSWRILWTEEPGRLHSIELQRVEHGWSDLACMHAWAHIRHCQSKAFWWCWVGVCDSGMVDNVGLLSSFESKSWISLKELDQSSIKKGMNQRNTSVHGYLIIYSEERERERETWLGFPRRAAERVTYYF